MAKLSRAEREKIAETRLIRVLRQHTVANARTLEQKISDAGPYGQRIDPHVLTGVRNRLVKDGAISLTRRENAPWFHISNSPPEQVAARLNEQAAVFTAYNAAAKRTGQALEIATFRAPSAAGFEYQGRYKDLDKHDDSQTYSKEEPLRPIGNLSLEGDELLDFIIRHPDAGHLGVECKNVRHWLYPDSQEVMDAIRKCVALNCVPVLIARRIAFVTFSLLTRCGGLVHQTYNQLYPEADADVAAKAKDKTILGYHDIRLGNEPDARLTKFISVNLPTIAVGARKKFEQFNDLLHAFASREMGYDEFAARVRRRDRGTKEDDDFTEYDPPDWFDGE